jgi:hypothetical protein
MMCIAATRCQLTGRHSFCDCAGQGLVNLDGDNSSVPREDFRESPFAWTDVEEHKVWIGGKESIIEFCHLRLPIGSSLPSE